MTLAPRPLRVVDYRETPWADIPKDEHGFPVPGSMFWMNSSGGHCENHEPPCARHLVVVCPDKHLWNIDSRASNCTLPEDKTHRCWVRHGEPPNVTVDKNAAREGQTTCDAGAGSIKTPDWHGYLRDGWLVD